MQQSDFDAHPLMPTAGGTTLGEPVPVGPIPRPLPDAGVTIRPGTLDDVPFLDRLQRMHTKQVGWMPTQQFVGKIKLGHVLIAVAATPASPCIGPVRSHDPGDTSDAPARGDAGVAATEPVGYLIGNDQYFKRDDVGIIYQMNVLPGRQRGLVGATLLKAQFERSAYGCKLYCCWCAQDIAANRFWEAMGFVPLAFRAGSEKKSRTHIFWQKRIRQNDTGDVSRGGTPWWFPSKTAGGSIREDRIVLPIPPGTHWSDAKPLIFPELIMPAIVAALPDEKGRVGFNPPSLVDATTPLAVRKDGGLKPALRKKTAAAPAAEPPKPVRRNGLMFDIPQPGEVLPETLLAEATPAKAKPPKPARVKRKTDPRLASTARELRDRWLEQVNGQGEDGRSSTASPLIGSEKYAVARLPGAAVTVEAVPMKRLAA